MPSGVAPESDESEEGVDVAGITGIVFIDQHDRETSVAPGALHGGRRRSRLRVFGREVLVQVLEGDVSAIGEHVRWHFCLGSPGWAASRRLGAYGGMSSSDRLADQCGNVVEVANWET